MCSPEQRGFSWSFLPFKVFSLVAPLLSFALLPTRPSNRKVELSLTECVSPLCLFDSLFTLSPPLYDLDPPR